MSTNSTDSLVLARNNIAEKCTSKARKDPSHFLIHKCRPEIEYLLKLSPAKTKRRIKDFDKRTIDVIGEVSKNLVNRKLKLSQSSIPESQKRKLIKNFQFFKEISKKSLLHTHRKQLMIDQKGGSLIPLLLGVALPLIQKIWSASTVGSGSD